MVRRIFLCFDYLDINIVNLFRGQASNTDLEIDFYDGSLKDEINSQNAEYIKSKIKPKIQNASVSVCLIGNHTHKSGWVDWEIETSNQLNKGLVGVRLHSSAADVSPNRLQKLGAEVVDWNGQQINAAIERAAKHAGY